MKANCDRALLARGVQVASAVALSRSPKPALACVKMEVESGRMTLLATDLEIGIRVEVDKIDIQEPGHALVPADRLHAILRELPEDTVSLTATEREMRVDTPKSHFTILGESAADFPNVPVFTEDGAFSVVADDLMAMTKKTIFAVAKENTRYALNGILWEVDGSNLCMVATDGRRLSLARGKCKGGPAEKVSVIVPAKAMQLIERCLADAGGAKAEVRVILGSNEILVEVPSAEGGRRIIYSRLVDGHFPKYEDVIPRDFDRKATLDTQAFLGAVRQAALLTNEETRGVMLKFSESELVLTSKTPEMGEAQISMAVQFEGEPMEIGFNPQYLMDAVKVIDAPHFLFSFKGSDKPGAVTEGRTFTHVLMPVAIV